ncbi:formylglycine-generating enzyme family protein [Sphingopyxis macrogoltabida]|uniref:Cysteine-type sulfatase aerobic maturase n=1 Tax=Sphingopyxis macrogoltabida TaxID=33050 RepID=A0AAC8YZ11_SPHMC|nr:formylglycine-generating enzyme family protein [Sphingopyxis macrogoltabida]ALJ13653.1 cysteine-type sulfatase aerobic maturase [Sphingopyxis macrogoltabida]AMU88903.1 cysteine-type sulfatase aerobic maturase [Sphingopyxis macrogoltabida]
MKCTAAIAALTMLGALAACGEATKREGRAAAAAPECPALPKADYAWIPGASFTMGADGTLPEEGPAREVKVAGFWIATHEVTNAEFAEFVKATGYKTLAEQDPPKLPGAPPEMLIPGSAVFTAPTDGNPNWWRWAVGAEWRHPAGPETNIAGRDRDPVVQIGYDDALAYAKWKGKALPSEEQWELAAATGGADRNVPVGKDGKPRANYYQGTFPVRDMGTDGFTGRAPVACFPADDHGVHDLIGNVWEWTTSTAGAETNVIKGGSFLCAANYCARYRPAARQFQERGLGTDHIGFRLIDTTRPAPAAPAPDKG